MSWCTIESDPGVFTELVEKFGASGCEFAELYSLDDAELAQLQPVFGLIFLFKWTGEKDDRPCCDEVPGLFFAKQVVSNACATQAILGCLLNRADAEGLTLGPALEELKTFAADLPFDMRGLAIENAEKIRTAHNAFARPEPFVSDDRKATKDDDVFHFITYVPFNGRVYELDGLRPGPCDLGESGSDWLGVARSAIQARIEKYSASEIKFNLMAIIRDKRAVLQEKRALLEAAGDAGSVAECDAQLAQEIAKREMWSAENVRRHHNYVPLVVDLFKVLAEKGKLQDMVSGAREKASAAKAK